MPSKEEIEKAKERLVNLGKSIQTNCKEKSSMATSIETFLQYIDELEQQSKKQSKMIDEMTEFIVSSAIVDDTVCSRIFCDKEGKCSYKKQKKCTKQYFEKKVEE